VAEKEHLGKLYVGEVNGKGQKVGTKKYLERYYDLDF